MYAYLEIDLNDADYVGTLIEIDNEDHEILSKLKKGSLNEFTEEEVDAVIQLLPGGGDAFDAFNAYELYRKGRLDSKITRIEFLVKAEQP